MKLTRLVAFVILHSAFVIPAAHAQRAVLKNPATGALVEGFASGANTITLSATGTLHWTSGATLGGSASAFRTAAGLAIGSDVQAYSANLTTYAGITPSANVQSLLAAADYSAMRTQLGLVIGTNVQAYDAELAALAALANASGVLRNNGSGTLSYLGTSAGGNGGDDNGKVLVFGSSGDITGYSTVRVRGASGRFGQLVDNGLLWSDVPGNLTHAIVANAPTGIRDHTLPDVSGTFITTGNLSSITATGTITSGTWQGSIIAPAYLGSGSSISTKYLRGDGTWQTISAGLTIGTTAITGGTSGRVLYNNAGTVDELTTTGSGDVVRATSPTLVTPALGTPSSCVGTNITGIPASSILAGQFGTGNFTFYNATLPRVTLSDGSSNGFYIEKNAWRTNFRNAQSNNRMSFIDGSGNVMLQLTNEDLAVFPRYGIALTSSNTASGTIDVIVTRDAAATPQLGYDHATTPTNQTLKAHDVTTGTGAKLTLAGGKGSAAGGAVALATSATNGAPVEHVTVSAAGLIALVTRGSGISAIATVVKAAHDCASIAAGATATTTATITGAAAGSTFIPSPIVHEGLVISAARTGTDTVTITFYNPTAGAIDASAVDVRVTEIAF